MKIKTHCIFCLFTLLIPSSSFAQDYLPMIPESMATAACSIKGNLDMNSKISYVLDPRNYVKENTTLSYLVLKQYNAMQKLPNPEKTNELFVIDYFERTLKKCPKQFTLEERNHFQGEINQTRRRYGQ